MKKCKYCQTEIDSKAKICPNCRKKQGIPKWLLVIIIFVVICTIVGISSSSESSDSESQTGETIEDITLLDGYSGSSDSSYSYTITGTLQNNTSKDYSYISVEFYAYDSEGNLIDTCLDNNSGMEANGTWKFSATCFISDGNASQITSYKLKEITKW